MSIGLVIANIAGSIRESSPAGSLQVSTDAGVTGKSAPVSASASNAASAGNVAFSQPLSGQSSLTPGFTIVVEQLLNEQGTVVSTIPTAQQLAAYRNGTATPQS